MLLQAALDGMGTIDGDTVEAVAAEMAAESLQGQSGEKTFAVKPPRFSFVEPTAERNPADARILHFEARLDEQERALRRVLTLLVDWVEGDEAKPRGSLPQSNVA